MTGADPADLALAWLLCAGPSDRALAGWAPAHGTRQLFTGLLREHGILPDWPVPGTWPPHPCGPGMRHCADGHEAVLWHEAGLKDCWCHGAGVRSALWRCPAPARTSMRPPARPCWITP
jgi:hypothetical protein